MAMKTGSAPTVGGVPVDEPAALSAAACMFRSLGDPARLAILRHLALGEHKVVDLTANASNLAVKWTITTHGDGASVRRNAA